LNYPTRAPRQTARIGFGAAIAIGIGPQISDIPGANGMRKKQKTPRAENAATTPSAVQDCEEQLRTILETAVEGIITIDEDSRVASFNPAAEKIFGYPAGEIIGQNVSVLMATPHREQHDGDLKNCWRSGQAKVIGSGRETVARKKDGTLFPIDLSVSEVRLSGRRLFTGFIRDSTERKRLEKEILKISEREQQRIGQDLHDGLCQQLAGIEMLAQVLAQKLAPKSKAAATRAAEIAAAVREAIGQTRLLARGLSPVTLESEGLMSALAELAANTEKMFRVRCEFICPAVVKCDAPAAATHLFRIAQEAVSNAIKHGRAKKISIHLRAEPGRVHLRIGDNGGGLPKPFSGGTGMGLRLMRSRIGMVGGALTIEANPGGGTCVVCWTPNKKLTHGCQE